jgi:hypothetical protein
MITDDQGYEWAKSKGITTLEEYNKLASEYSSLKESYDHLLIDIKFNHATLGSIIDDHR